MQSEINPWSANQSIDTDKLFTEFGIEPIEPVIPEIHNPPRHFCAGAL